MGSCLRALQARIVSHQLASCSCSSQPPAAVARPSWHGSSKGGRGGHAGAKRGSLASTNALGGLVIQKYDAPIKKPPNQSNGAQDGACANGVCKAASSDMDQLRLRQMFDEADKDGNNVLDIFELRSLLEQTNGDMEDSIFDWLSEAELGQTLNSYDADGSGDINFEEFVHMVNDGLLLSGKLREYRAAFSAADLSQNGTIGGQEIERLFKNLGHPINSRKLFKIMEQYDRDASGQIEFNEFLMMFRDELLDLREIMDYIQLNPARGGKGPASSWPRSDRLVEVNPGEVIHIFSDQEFEQILKNYPDQTIAIMASLTWCRPCIGFEKSYERFAEMYKDVIFLKFYGNSNAMTKFLFEERLKTTQTPAFSFFRTGTMLHGHHGANLEKMEGYLQRYVLPTENPAKGLSLFKKQAWRRTLGIKKS